MYLIVGGGGQIANFGHKPSSSLLQENDLKITPQCDVPTITQWVQSTEQSQGELILILWLYIWSILKATSFKKRCNQWSYLFFLELFRFLCFLWIRKCQNVWCNHRLYCIIEGTFFVVSFEPYAVSKWNMLKYLLLMDSICNPILIQFLRRA